MREASYVLEGALDRAVLNRLLTYTKLMPGTAQLYGGDPHFQDKPIKLLVQGEYVTLKQRAGQPLVLEVVQLCNAEARHKRWVAITDLDNKFLCAGLARQQWLPNPAPYLCFRIAVQEIEAWLLADREMISKFLAVPINNIPHNPDLMISPMPKEALLTLADKSGMAGMVKGSGTGVEEGNLYTSQLGEFVRKWWRPAVAAQNSPSLKKCIERLQQLAKGQAVN